MKGKPLLPTLRTKKRYVVYKVISDKKYSHNTVVRAIKKSYIDSFGRIGFGRAGFMDTRIHSANKGVLKINNKYLDKLRIAMGMVKDIDGNKAIIRTILVSGILKKAKAEVI
jgi:ribonuclease P/MRP protein subunit POP5